MVILYNEVLAALAKHLTVGLIALGFAAGAPVLEPNLHLTRLHAQFHRQRVLLVRVRSLQPLERVLQHTQLRFREPQLLAGSCTTLETRILRNGPVAVKLPVRRLRLNQSNLFTFHATNILVLPFFMYEIELPATTKLFSWCTRQA